LGGIVAATIGWNLRQKSGRFGWVLLIGGPIATIFFAPSMFLDRVTVDDTGFSRRSGIFGMTAVQDVTFVDVSGMRLTSEEERGRRGRKVTKYYLYCDRKSGEAVKFPVNNAVCEAALLQILRTAAAAGIRIDDNISGGIQ
jgi:hypothetical protein